MISHTEDNPDALPPEAHSPESPPPWGSLNQADPASLLLDIPSEAVDAWPSGTVGLFVTAVIVVVLVCLVQLVANAAGVQLSQTAFLITVACVGWPALMLVQYLDRYAVARSAKREAMTVHLDDLGVVIRNILDDTGFFAGNSVGLLELCRVLARRGRQGTTLRIAAERDLVRIDPLLVPFEPRPLNEADSIFEDLDAVSQADKPGPDSRRVAPPEDSDWRQVKRNVRLRGGWVLCTLGFMGLALSATGSYVRGRPAWRLFLYGGLLVLFVLKVVRSGNSARVQWLLVPGGLVRREARYRDPSWQIHTFERQDSVLCVSRLTQQQWRFVVANADVSDVGLITKREADHLLRAWLSPLPAPPLERLSDLV